MIHSARVTIVLKQRAPLAKGGGIFLPIFCYDGFLLMWCNFKFEGVLFRSDSRHTDRVDTLWDYLLQGPSKGPHNITSTASGLICPKSGTDDTTNCSIVAGKS